MIFRWTVFVIWIAGSLSFFYWTAQQSFPVGRMILPRQQALALAGVIVALLSLGLCWIWLALWTLLKAVLPISATSWVERPLFRWALIGAFLLLGGLLLYGRYLEPKWIARRTLSLGRERPPPPPPGASIGAPLKPTQLRLVVLSDLHVSGQGAPWSDLAPMVNRLAPDVILLLGDMLNRRTALPYLQQTLQAMRARQGKYAVRGNWDVWYWHDLPLLAHTGFHWLDHTKRTVRAGGTTLHLVGAPYGDQTRGFRVERMLATLPATDWRIFLYHTPDLALDVPSADLYLAGHTHGGQIALPFFGALVTLSRHGKRFERGLSQVGQTTVYVNPGIGVEPIIPLRLGVRPEITLIILGPKGKYIPRET